MEEKNMTTKAQNNDLPAATMSPDPDRPYASARYAVNDGYKAWILFAIILLGVCAVAAFVFAQEPQTQHRRYHVTNLDSLGGLVSRGNSINDRTWVAGYSNLAGDQSRHAVLWRHGSILDLGTLGGPNSTVPWPVKDDRGIIVGIAQTATPEPLGEAWSSSAFYTGPNSTGYINLGFVWEHGHMTALPTLGGDNSFATGANNEGEIVGWAENTCHDPTCVPPQVLQFRPVIWQAAHPEKIRELPLFREDTSGAATAINDDGQVVGISGICDQAIGRYTARHAVLWENGKVTDLGNLGARWWNTPMAINQQGDVAGFAGDPSDRQGNILHAFIWTRQNGMRPLPPLPGHVYSEADGINANRQAVGISCDASFADCRAVVWENGFVTDLNALKQSDYGFRLEQGKDINDEGEITGRAINPTTGERRAFVARPVFQR
jgi:probable HAF family extracellular repeat protein